MVAGEPLRRVGAPAPHLLRSPPLISVKSFSSISPSLHISSSYPY